VAKNEPRTARSKAKVFKHYATEPIVQAPAPTARAPSFEIFSTNAWNA